MKRSLQHSSIAVALAAVALMASGCDQGRNSTVGQKVDRATDRVASATKDAAQRTEDVVGDAALTAKVKSALVAEPNLKSLQINVDTKDSVVTLAGSVNSQSDKERATQVASAVAGVRQVEDKLQVKS